MREQNRKVTARGLLYWGVACALAWAQTGLAQSPEYHTNAVELPPMSLALPIATALTPIGARLMDASGHDLGEMWMRGQIPLRTDSELAGYGAMTEGTLVGVLSFPFGGTDFRGHGIPAGVYTLRYAHLAPNGTESGAPLDSDFVLLCPAADDRTPDAPANFAALLDLSRRASPSRQPAPLKLSSALASDESPGYQRTVSGYVALRLKTTALHQGADAPEAFPVAVVLVGKAEP